MLEAVIFDMDGVIMDSEPIHYETELEIIKRFGVTDYAPEDHAKYVGMRTWDLWTGNIAKYGLDTTAEALTIEGDEAYINALREKDFGPIEGLLPLLNRIQSNGIRMIVASSASRENIKLVLDKFAITDFFEGYVSSQDVKKTKPNPDIFLLAAKTLDVSPEHCVVIEDAKHGVQAAISAGMKCIGYRNLNSGNQDLSKAHIIVNTHDNIDLKLLEELTIDALKH
ncbi:HAD family phosphatase [Reichenbachiella carrageenanivorans]|uniref:HAD family phosphatase n=1 Tax=Reichenbachiella carrageenanivorans TaxID=2979869 RepID=A0ABY6CW35_9BACT|nr:HAD family phosphatase [Reichenbachiella carrageenanivorans]UXX78122.1 HAD family phosphatase [Reichenbachiella carrageenanivorans]